MTSLPTILPTTSVIVYCVFNFTEKIITENQEKTIFKIKAISTEVLILYIIKTKKSKLAVYLFIFRKVDMLGG